MKARIAIGALGAVLVVTQGTATARAHDPAPDPFAPCHVLCSVETNRHEASATRDAAEGQPVRDPIAGGRLELAFVHPVGRYAAGEYTPLAAGARVGILQILPSVWVRPVPWLQLGAGMPWEMNEAENVVLPALREEPGITREQAPGGIFASAQVRLPLPATLELEAWAGVGYRLSDPIGTVDVSGVLQEEPALAIEGLGAGTDDIYVRADARWRPVRLGGWTFGAGFELREHTMPRLRNHFATTFAGHLVAAHPLGDRWTLSGTLGGFVTWIEEPEIVQHNLAIARANATWRSDVGLDFGFGVGAVVPGPWLNENALLYWSNHLFATGAW